MNPARLHNGYRICADHFEKKMFTNRFCNRLNFDAVPTWFPSLEGSSKNQDHSYSRRELLLENVESLAKRIEFVQDVIVSGKFL